MGYSPWGTKELDLTEQVTSLGRWGRQIRAGYHRKEMTQAVCGAQEKGERVRLLLPTSHGFAIPTTRRKTLQNLTDCQVTDPDYKTLNSLLATSWKAPP